MSFKNILIWIADANGGVDRDMAYILKTMFKGDLGD